MWALVHDLLRELFRLGMALGLERVEQWRADCAAALARERQRLFEVLALLCLGLMLFALGLAGLLLLAWWAMPLAWRLPAMGALLLLLAVSGALVLAMARRRWARAL